jgi:hypothetical protein
VLTELVEELMGELDGGGALGVEQLVAALREASQPVPAVAAVRQVQQHLQRQHQHVVPHRVCPARAHAARDDTGLVSRRGKGRIGAARDVSARQGAARSFAASVAAAHGDEF